MNFSGISRSSVLGFLLRLPLKLVPKNAVVPVLQGKLRGKKWIAGSGNHGCWLGSYEFEKQQYIIQTIQADATVYDVGAHVGYYTLLFSEMVGDSGKVVAFEPLPNNIAYIKRHLELNNLHNVRLIEAAVADQPGKTYFQVAVSSSMGHITDTKTTDTVEVDRVSLDDLIAQNNLPRPDYIKFDIEGAELLALQGALNTLQQHHPTVFLATHGKDVHAGCCALLSNLGYSLSTIDGSAVMETDEIVATFA